MMTIVKQKLHFPRKISHMFGNDFMLQIKDKILTVLIMKPPTERLKIKGNVPYFLLFKGLCVCPCIHTVHTLAKDFCPSYLRCFGYT